jgi:protein-S-isoprenylcysteine O-methyltransferase Ste14
MALVFLLLASHRLDVGLLARRFVSESSLLTGFGIFLTFVGAAIAIWARYCLGQYWSARVTLKMDHRLIRSGPYTYVRHPIYSGLLLAMAGTALVIGEWRAVVAVLIAILEFSRKASKEEVFLTTEFNVDYQEYRKHAGFLIPRFR